MLSTSRARGLHALPLAVLLGLLLLLGVFARSAAAAPAWLAPVTVSAAGQHASVPQIALDGGGNAVAVWCRYDGTHTIVQSAFRPAGGAWQAPVALSAAGRDALDPQVAFDAAGDAFAVWTRSDGTNQIAQAAVRPAGGTWQAPVSLSGAGQDAAYPQIGADGTGDAVAVWTRAGFGEESRVQAAARPAGGPWQAPVSLSAAGQDAYDAQVAIDPHGAAVAVWDRSDGTDQIVQVASRAAGGAWQPPLSLSASGQNAIYPQVAVDGQGTAAVVWQRFDGVNSIVQAAVRPAGGSWPSSPVDVSLADGSAEAPQVALDAAGNAVAVWQRFGASGSVVQAASRPVGGGWQAPVPLSRTGHDAEAPQVAIGDHGDAVAVWDRADGARTIVQAAVRPAGGGWSSTPDDLSDAGQSATGAQVAVDGQGDAVATWLRGDGIHLRVQAAGYDGGSSDPTPDPDPDLPPGPGPAPDPAPDPEPEPAPVAPAPSIPSDPSRDAPTAPSVRPVITRLSQSHAVWRLGTKLASIASTSTAAVGTTISFHLNQAVRVTATFTRREPGRQSGRRCAAPSKQNLRGRPCTRTVTVGTLVRPGHGGRNTLAFHGLLSRTKKLKPGRYTVTFGATNAAGQRAAPKSLSFTVIRG